MDPDSIVIRQLREGYGAEDIECHTAGHISAARARRTIQRLRDMGKLAGLYRMWAKEAAPAPMQGEAS